MCGAVSSCTRESARARARAPDASQHHLRRPPAHHSSAAKRAPPPCHCTPSLLRLHPSFFLPFKMHTNTLARARARANVHFVKSNTKKKMYRTCVQARLWADMGRRCASRCARNFEFFNFEWFAAVCVCVPVCVYVCWFYECVSALTVIYTQSNTLAKLYVCPFSIFAVAACPISFS